MEGGNPKIEEKICLKDLLSGKNILILFALLLIMICCFIIGYAFGLRNGILDGFSQCQKSYLSCEGAMLSNVYYSDKSKINNDGFNFGNYELLKNLSIK